MQDVFDFIAWSIVGLSCTLAVLVLIKINVFVGYLRYYGIWILSGSFMEIISNLLANNGYSNLFLFHLNAVLEFGLLVLFFDTLLKSLGYRGIRYVLYPGIAAILANSFFFQTIDTFNSYALTLISLCAVLMCIFTFLRLSDVVMSQDKKLFLIIIVGSVLILHSSTLFPLLFGNYLLEIDVSTQIVVWILRACVGVVVKIIIFFTLLSYVYSAELKV